MTVLSDGNIKGSGFVIYITMTDTQYFSTGHNHTVIKAYENQGRKLEEEKITLSENIAQCGRPLPDFDDTFLTTLDFLANPYKLWASDSYEDKRIVLKLTFADQLSYVKNEGFRTAAMSQPFSLLEDLHMGKKEMVEVSGDTSNRLFDVFRDWNALF